MKKVTLTILLFAALTGCAEKGPVHLTNIEYLRPEGLPESSPKIVGLSPLKDSRNKPESLVGTSGTYDQVVQNEVLVTGSVSNLVTSKLKEALKDRNIAVKEVPWDLTIQGAKADGVGLLIGGEIKTLWLDSKYKALKSESKATVQMKVYFIDPSEKVLHAIDISSSYENPTITFSVSELESALSQAISTAIDRIFDDKEMKKKLE